MSRAGQAPAELHFISFYADWAEPCKHINEVFEALVQQNKGSMPVLQKLAHFRALNVDSPEAQEPLDLYNIESVPEIVLVRNGKVAERVLGADPLALTRLVNRALRQLETDYLASRAGEPLAPGDSMAAGVANEGSDNSYSARDNDDDDTNSSNGRRNSRDSNSTDGSESASGRNGNRALRDKDRRPSTSSNSLSPDISNRLKAIIGTASLIIFIRGTREDPVDADSATLLALFKQHYPNLGFATFDLDRDPAVKSALKVFSDWPTYPQAYLMGEFLGGLDMLKRMFGNGEMEQTLKNAGLTQTGTLDAKMRSLIKCSPLMLFIKGTPEVPECGFTRTLLSLLHEHYPTVHYNTFDILKDDAIRQGLKRLSNWPTYPQIYLNGEFLGGLDVFKEMHASGEMAQMFQNANIM